MNKILLTAGCSWTDKDFISTDTSIPMEQRAGWNMWPEIIANKMNMKSVNMGKCGADNKHIFDSIVDSLYKHKEIGMVIIMFSSWDRFSYMGQQKIPLGSFFMSNHKFYKDRSKIYSIQEEFNNIFLNMNNSTLKKYSQDVINTNMRYMFLLANILKDKNIPFLIFQGLQAFPIVLVNEIEEMKAKYTDKDFITDIISNQYYNYIKSNKNIIGFPFMKIFNGYCINHLLEDGEYVSELDKHPNRIGQEKIANYIMEYINV